MNTLTLERSPQGLTEHFLNGLRTSPGLGRMLRLYGAELKGFALRGWVDRAFEHFSHTRSICSQKMCNRLELGSLPPHKVDGNSFIKAECFALNRDAVQLYPGNGVCFSIHRFSFGTECVVAIFRGVATSPARRGQRITRLATIIGIDLVVSNSRNANNCVDHKKYPLFIEVPQNPVPDGQFRLTSCWNSPPVWLSSWRGFFKFPA